MTQVVETGTGVQDFIKSFLGTSSALQEHQRRKFETALLLQRARLLDKSAKLEEMLANLNAQKIRFGLKQAEENAPLVRKGLEEDIAARRAQTEQARAGADVNRARAQLLSKQANAFDQQVERQRQKDDVERENAQIMNDVAKTKLQFAKLNGVYSQAQSILQLVDKSNNKKETLAALTATVDDPAVKSILNSIDVDKPLNEQMADLGRMTVMSNPELFAAMLANTYGISPVVKVQVWDDQTNQNVTRFVPNPILKQFANAAQGILKQSGYYKEPKPAKSEQVSSAPKQPAVDMLAVDAQNIARTSVEEGPPKEIYKKGMGRMFAPPKLGQDWRLAEEQVKNLVELDRYKIPAYKERLAQIPPPFGYGREVPSKLVPEQNVPRVALAKLGKPSKELKDLEAFGHVIRVPANYAKALSKDPVLKAYYVNFFVQGPHKKSQDATFESILSKLRMSQNPQATYDEFITQNRVPGYLAPDQQIMLKYLVLKLAGRDSDAQKFIDSINQLKKPKGS